MLLLSFRTILRISPLAFLLLQAHTAGASDSRLMAAALRADCVPSQVTPVSSAEQMSTWIVHCRGHGEDTIVVTCIPSDCFASPNQAEPDED